MNKKFAVFLSTLFCCFLGGMALVSLILPKQTFSPMENRYLQKAPALTPERVMNGSFMRQKPSPPKIPCCFTAWAKRQNRCRKPRCCPILPAKRSGRWTQFCCRCRCFPEMASCLRLFRR